MFMIRPYREEDAGGCGQCFYEGFFTCPIDENDRILLRDYAHTRFVLNRTSPVVGRTSTTISVKPASLAKARSRAIFSLLLAKSGKLAAASIQI